MATAQGRRGASESKTLTTSTVMYTPVQVHPSSFVLDAYVLTDSRISFTILYRLAMDAWRQRVH